MTSDSVSLHVVRREAGEVTERAAVSGSLVVDALLVLMQSGDGGEGLVAQVTAVTAESRVQGLVLLQTMAPPGAERTVTAAVRTLAAGGRAEPSGTGPPLPVDLHDLTAHAGSGPGALDLIRLGLQLGSLVALKFTVWIDSVLLRCVFCHGHVRFHW